MKSLRTADKNIVGRGRLSAKNDATKAIRSARGKLSQTGTKVTFGNEFLAIFAQNQQAALPISLILVAATALTLIAVEAISPMEAAVWISLLLASYSLMLRRARLFLKTSREAESYDKKARRDFLILSALSSLVWAGLIGFLWWRNPGVDYKPLVFCFLLIYIAKSAQIGSAIRMAPFAACAIPVALFSALLATTPTAFNLAMAIILPGALIFVSVIAAKLQASYGRDLALQREKDAMIADLETARVMSETARSQAEDANLAKSRFLAAMSHELRTPLNAILGFSEVMSNELMGPIENEHYKEYSKDIHASGSHLLSLINEILDLSRVEAGRYELREEPIFLRDVIHDAHQMIEMRAAAKNINLTCKIQEDLPRVLADEKSIRQIMLNLLSNAVKFTPNGGAVVLKLGWTSSGGQYFSVTDNGPGIPEDEIAIVLSPFGQGSIAIDSAEQGTGLGLPIVRAMVELHQGKFDLQSRLRQGTVVTVKLPARRVLLDMPAYEEARGNEKHATKGNRIMNVGKTPKLETPLQATPAPAPDLSEEESEASEQMLRRIHRVLKEDAKR
jgi:two-component system cell cycle sensor histidine kinase PleC